MLLRITLLSNNHHPLNKGSYPRSSQDFFSLYERIKFKKYECKGFELHMGHIK